MKNNIISMVEEISKAQKDSRRNFGKVDVEFVANANEALRNGNCKITFRKVNGEIVETIATTRKNVTEYNIKHTGHRYNGVTPFFDLINMRWRSFRWDNLISCELLGN